MLQFLHTPILLSLYHFQVNRPPYVYLVYRKLNPLKFTQYQDNSTPLRFCNSHATITRNLIKFGGNWTPLNLSIFNPLKKQIHYWPSNILLRPIFVEIYLSCGACSHEFPKNLGLRKICQKFQGNVSKLNLSLKKFCPSLRACEIPRSV